ncbi:hypothetical protein MTP99_011552 [Tenebrio molitor]|jgi:hypothetical protein|nr:hypothetical protein MTP99_011552 [Tenebrio molitor]
MGFDSRLERITRACRMFDEESNAKFLEDALEKKPKFVPIKRVDFEVHSGVSAMKRRHEDGALFMLFLCSWASSISHSRLSAEHDTIRVMNVTRFNFTKVTGNFFTDVVTTDVTLPTIRLCFHKIKSAPG